MSGNSDRSENQMNLAPLVGGMAINNVIISERPFDITVGGEVDFLAGVPARSATPVLDSFFKCRNEQSRKATYVTIVPLPSLISSTLRLTSLFCF